MYVIILCVFIVGFTNICMYMYLAASEDPEWILVEKDRFVNDYDRDADGRLDPQEVLSWVVPNNQGIAQEEVSITE